MSVYNLYGQNLRDTRKNMTLESLNAKEVLALRQILWRVTDDLSEEYSCLYTDKSILTLSIMEIHYLYIKLGGKLGGR